MLWVRISTRARCTTLCDQVCQSLETGRWFSQGLPVSSTNKTDRHDTTEILLKVALNTIKQTDLYIAPIMIHAQQVFTRLYTEFWDSLFTIFFSLFVKLIGTNPRSYSHKWQGVIIFHYFHGGCLICIKNITKTLWKRKCRLWQFI